MKILKTYDCFGCGEELIESLNPPVFDESELLHARSGHELRKWCSEQCHEDSSEEYGMRRYEVNLT